MAKASTELEPFGITSDGRGVEDEGAVIPMFADGGCEYDGPYFKMPFRMVLPKPIQKPHPPLWAGVPMLTSIEMAGGAGWGRWISSS